MPKWTYFVCGLVFGLAIIFIYQGASSTLVLADMGYMLCSFALSLISSMCFFLSAKR